MSDYAKISIDYLKTKKRNPSEIEIQQIPNVLLLNSGYGIGDLDDGLIYIGTNYCYNHDQPLCNKCPIKNLCLGYKQRKDLISNYRT
jgi:adenine-specific DNA glycosylase